MTFAEVVQELKRRPVFEIRAEEFNYFEVVFKKEGWVAFSHFLNEKEGGATKEAGRKPDSQIKKLADPFGGVRDNQIFYQSAEKENGWGLVIWPWTDEQYFTLKLFSLPR